MVEKIPVPDFSQIVRSVTLEVKDRIVRRTPVATGRAQAGWQATSEPTKGQITNVVPYIGFLEDGTVHMAAVGMVRTTLEELPDIIRDAYKAQRT